MSFYKLQKGFDLRIFQWRYRLGTRGVKYSKIDEEHFSLTTDVELSAQFYGWLCGFGDMAKILSPETAVVEFTEYLDKIRSIYWKCILNFWTADKCPQPLPGSKDL